MAGGGGPAGRVAGVVRSGRCLSSRVLKEDETACFGDSASGICRVRPCARRLWMR